MLPNTHGLLKLDICAVGATSLLAIALWMLLTPRTLTAVAYPGLFLVCAVLCAVVARHFYGDWFSPVVLMTLGWVGPVILYALDLSPFYLVRFRPETWWIIIGTLFLFDAGCFVAIGTKLSRGPLLSIEQQTRGARQNSQPAETWRRYVLYGYFIIGLAAWVYRVESLGGFSGIVLLSDEPDFVRWQQLPRVIGQMPILLLVLPLLCLTRWESAGFQKSKALWLLAGISLATCILDTARSNIFQMVFVGMLFWMFRRGEFPKKSLAVITACCLLLFGLVSWQRSQMAEDDSIGRVVDNVGIVSTLALPYVYLTTSLANVQLNLDEGRTAFDGGGVRMFMPILSWLQVYKPEQIGNYISDWPGGISLYQADCWIDFGWAGLLLGPFGLGLVCGWVYRRSRVQRTSLRAMMYAVLATAVITSGVVNWFNSPTTWFFLLLIPPAVWCPEATGIKRGHDFGGRLTA